MLTIKDFKTAFHSLLKAKGYVISIVLTLGITLGALVAMFNLNYQLLAKPLPYKDQERLTLLRGNLYNNGQINLANMFPYPAAIEVYKNDRDHFEQKALVAFNKDIIRNLPDAPQVNTSYITPEYLQLVQVPMLLGRNFNINEGLDDNTPVVIISYATWQQLFYQDVAVLGKTMRFGDVDFKIVGVTAADFTEPQLMSTGRLTQVWLPWDFNLERPSIRTGWGWFPSDKYLVGKLKSTISKENAAQELTSHLNARFKEEMVGKIFFKNKTLSFQLVTYNQVILGDSKSRVLLMFAGALVLLLIAATNIINLILSRAANKHRQMAIQAVLGAQKTHLFNGVLAEILWVMALAILLSIAVAFGGVLLLKEIAHNQLPRLVELGLSWQSLVFAFVFALLLAVMFTFLVNRQINYRALNSMLQSSGKGSGIQISRKVRHLLILAQVALTGILLTGSFQVLQISWRHIQQPLGLSIADIIQVELNLGTATQEKKESDILAIRTELQQHPKIAAVSIESNSPLTTDTNTWFSYLSLDADLQQQKQALCYRIDEHYFNILGVEWVAGRNVTAEEFKIAAHVVVINETFARKLQPDGKVLNQRFFWLNSNRKKEPYEVVGIIRDLSLPGREESPRMFFPELSSDFPQLLLKLKSDQQLSNVELNTLMAKVNSQYKVSQQLSMARAHQLFLAQDTLFAGITAVLVLLALSLAAIGIYGVLSYSVQLRRFELGVRMAIGARPNKIFLQILKDNLAPVIIGLGVALIVLISLWLWIQQTSYSLQTTSLGWLLPPVLIISLTAATSLLSVWKIIRKPASYVLRGD